MKERKNGAAGPAAGTFPENASGIAAAFRKCVRASFTIEAAFICPIVLFTILALLLSAFRLHDRVLERTALSLELAAPGGTAGNAAADPFGSDSGCDAAADPFSLTSAGNAAADPSGNVSAEEEWQGPSERAQRLLDARIYARENEIRVSPGLLRLTGTVGDYEESRSRLRPEDILRKKVLFEEEDH